MHLREALSTNVDVAKRLAELEMKTESLELSHDTFSSNTRLQLRQLLDAVRELTTPPDPPKRPIGFVTHEDKKDAPTGAAKAAVKVGRASQRLKKEANPNPHSFSAWQGLWVAFLF